MSAPAPEDFTPSCEAVTKQYSYTWAHGGKHGVLRPLFDRHFVVFSAYALDPAPMHEAAQSLVGTHDFLAFTKIDHGRETTVRTIHRCDVEGIDVAPRWRRYVHRVRQQDRDRRPMCPRVQIHEDLR